MSQNPVVLLARPWHHRSQAPNRPCSTPSDTLVGDAVEATLTDHNGRTAVIGAPLFVSRSSTIRETPDHVSSSASTRADAAPADIDRDEIATMAWTSPVKLALRFEDLGTTSCPDRNGAPVRLQNVQVAVAGAGVGRGGR